MKSFDVSKIIFTAPPPGFQPTIEAAGCFLECEGLLLYLLRASGCPEENTWCIPGGKLEAKESPRDAIIREVFEEIDLNIDDSDLSFFQSFYKRLPSHDSIFHVFRKPLLTKHIPSLRPKEHVRFQWITPQEGQKIPLISGGTEVLNFYLNHIK